MLYNQRNLIYMFIYIEGEPLDISSSEKLSGFRFSFEASCVTTRTEELWYNETICLWMTIYMLLRGLSTLAEELAAAIRLMQSFSNELSTLVSHSAKCKQTKANTNAL